MSLKEKSTWKVFFHTFLTHIRHDIQKGVDNQRYNWHNVQIERQGNRIKVFQNKVLQVELGLDTLGTESAHSEDNQVFNWLSSDTLKVKAQIKQSNLTTSQETKTMDKNLNEITSTLRTVGQQISESAITSAKMKAGETILLALRNIVMQKAGFMQKVKFKFAPVALDIAVVTAADVIVAELMPNKKSAKLATECLNLAMTKEVIDVLPITEFTNALTGGGALDEVKSLLSND